MACQDEKLSLDFLIDLVIRFDNLLCTHPLPLPKHPWMHLSEDFITDLPLSQISTVILVTIDWFSKFVYLVPLLECPTAFQTAELLCEHICWYFGLTEDIVSDQGPQFISRVWAGFMEKLGITVSLTSGYHPQANDQVKRANQKVGRFLRAYYFNNQGDWLGGISAMSWILPELCQAFCDQVTPIPMHFRAPASSIPLEHEPHGSPSSRQMVQTERTGVGTNASATGKCHPTSKGECWPTLRCNPELQGGGLGVVSHSRSTEYPRFPQMKP